MSGSTFLEGERVTLRPVERDDLEVIQRSRNDPEIRVPLGMLHPKNREQVEEGFEEWIESDDSATLLVCVDGDPIGETTMMHLDWTRPELAYWLVPEHHGEGYATEAVSLLIDYAFDNFEKRGLTARTFDSNDASKGLLESLGFTCEGRLRDQRFVRGKYVDVLLYGLLREEWVEEDSMAGSTFLDGERVTLRPIERDDVAFLQRAPTEPELRIPLGFTQPANQSQVEDQLEERVESDDSLNLLVCIDDEPAGSVRINFLDWTRPLLSYWLVPEFHGEGYMTEAVSLLLDYFFESFENRGLCAFAFAFNDASRGLLETLGFKEEARGREDRFVDGEYVDSVHYGLLREEWTGEEGHIR